MVQQFPHHVVEPPDFFNPFYLLVNDVSAKTRPIFSVSTRLFMSFSLLPAFPFFLHPHGFFTLSRHSFPGARLFFVSLHSQGRHTHHSHSYELPIASFSPAFSLFSALSLPQSLSFSAPLRSTAGLFSDRPLLSGTPLFRHSFSSVPSTFFPLRTFSPLRLLPPLFRAPHAPLFRFFIPSLFFYLLRFSPLLLVWASKNIIYPNAAHFFSALSPYLFPAAFQPLSRTFFIAHPFFFSPCQNPAPAFPENSP